MKKRTRGFLTIMGALMALAPTTTLAQAGPQDNFVFEPDRAWGSSGTSNGQFTCSFGLDAVFPLGIATDATNVYVADFGNHRIQAFTPEGDYLRQWGNGGVATGQLWSPAGVAVDDLHVFVVEKDNNRVQVFTKDGAYVRHWGGFSGPLGIAIDTQRVYVADTVNNRIQAFDKNGTLITSWGTLGSVAGQFNRPTCVATDGRQVFVVDAWNQRLQVFDRDGNYLRGWSLPIAIPDNGLWQSTFSLAVDAQAVYVGVAQTRLAPVGRYLQVYDKQGTLLWQTANATNSPLQWPAGIAVGNPLSFIFDPGGPRILPFRRIFRTLGALEPDAIPLTDVVAVNQRSGLPVVDVDYVVTDGNDSTVTVYAVAFAASSNAAPDLNDVVPMRTFVEGTESNVGPGVLVGVPHRLSWDATADGLMGKIPQYGNIQVALLAKDNRGLLDLHFLQIPAVDTNAAFQISRDPLLDRDFLPLWFWLLGAGDPAIRLSDGEVVGVGGAYNDQVLAQGSNTTAAGRAFLFERLDVREATPPELTVAREGGTPGTVTDWEPRREPPPAGSKVNAFNFVTEPTNGWWVAPVTP